jgi:hypothetical protein
MWKYALKCAPDGAQRSGIIKAIERCAADLGLEKARAEHSPARSHWHWKRRGKTGTLETTYNVLDRTVVVSVHKNRVGTEEWAKNMAPHFAAALAKSLGRSQPENVTNRG